MLLTILFVVCGALAAEDKPPAFSHKTHAPLKYPCVKCHTGAMSGEAAKFPAASVCQTCHPGREVPKFPTARVYKLPAMVIFSHARHAAAKASCANCHGEVTQFHQLKAEASSKVEASIKAEASTNMKACVECHKKGGATTACAACHELGQ